MFAYPMPAPLDQIFDSPRDVIWLNNAIYAVFVIVGIVVAILVIQDTVSRGKSHDAWDAYRIRRMHR
jgi:hypothetical protein